MSTSTVQSAAEAAHAASEAVRALNHATLNRGGLTYPSDVYDVLGALVAMTQRLPQAFGQLAQWLQREHDAGRVRVVDGSDTGSMVRALAVDLEVAARHAERLLMSLDRAFNATAFMAYDDSADADA